MKQVVLTILAVICICVSTLSSGIVFCTQCPQVTEALSRATALVDTSEFSRDQLVTLAEKTQGFVAGTVTKEELYSTLEQVNKDANTKYKDLKDSDFAAADEEYSLNSKAMSHLEDVRVLMANVKIALGICVAGALIFCILLVITCGSGALGRALAWSGGIILIGFIALGIWAFIDFNGMFNWLHSLFFKSDTWLFSSTSLLISMYPTAFWVGMGVICLAISTVISIILLIVGKIIS